MALVDMMELRDLYGNGEKEESDAKIKVEQMRHLQEAQNPDDDWTGLTLRTQRKKRQNRLNQRAYRRRKQIEEKQLSASKSSAPMSPQYVSDDKSSSPLVVFEKDREYRAPLSVDHLMLLVQYNFYRACLSNMHVVGSCEAERTNGTLILSSSDSSSSIPDTLTPTLLQRSTKHPAWIDCVPHPLLRDNFIRECGKYDVDEFWYDLVGDLHASLEVNHFKSDDVGIEDGDGNEKWRKRAYTEEFVGVVCWETPWRIEGYEFTARWLKKWWRLHGGCEELVVSSNWWRARRGEVPLVMEDLVPCEESISGAYT